MERESRNAAFLAKTYHPDSFHYRLVERPGEGAPLRQWIDYFDISWQKEGLPFNWYTLQNKNKKIGFSLQGQLRGLTDLTSEKQVNNFRQRSKQDLLGFKLEYLSDHLIYPRKYTIRPDINNPDDRTKLRLEDKMYGTVEGHEDHSPDIVEVVSADERNGTVKASLEKMKQFLLSPDTPDDSIAVMTSPLGETGLETDDGKSIRYPDSYFFIMQKKGDTVMNYSLKTNFSIEECREAVFRLKGGRLSQTASLEDVVTAIATITPEDGRKINRVEDVIAILQSIHPGEPHKNVAWSDVYQDVVEGEQLYEFDEKTQAIIKDFETFCEPGYATKLLYQKGLAATILRMSDAYYKQRQEENRPVLIRQGVPETVGRPEDFGAILNEVASKPGCAGGGEETTSVMTAGGLRLAVIGEDEHGSLSFNCPDCGQQNIRDRGELQQECTHCHSTKVAC